MMVKNKVAFMTFMTARGRNSSVDRAMNIVKPQQGQYFYEILFEIFVPVHFYF